MINSPILDRLQTMRRYFQSGATRTYQFRKQQLEKLKQAILDHEQDIHQALMTDLRKSPEESWVTETGFFISEINNTLRNLRRWMQPERKPTNLLNLPSSSYVIRQPLGVVLVIAPWNYPFQLLFTPVIGAIAAGNCVVLKPSEFAPGVSQVMKIIIEENFSSEYISLVEGDGAEVIPAMMKHFVFNHVFYTGSTAVGKSIYQMAAEHLVPVTLELGGKSPCVVEADADIKTAARRITLTKFSNAGQMCVAPDYVLVHRSKKDSLTNALKKVIPQFFGVQPEEHYNYGRIINHKQFDRILTYLKQGTVVYGGRSDRDKLFIEPTLLDDVSPDAPVMHEEIFGPILPIIAYKDFPEAVSIISRNPDPLAFYLFTSSKKNENQWVENISFGGGCINNASWHLTNHHLPFGGIGSSGMGRYHGEYSFETFSHKKAIMKTPTWFDPDVKYPPFKGKMKLFKWVIR
jgi:aldehyde dehydrogenase (NAD+)